VRLDGALVCGSGRHCPTTVAAVAGVRPAGRVPALRNRATSPADGVGTSVAALVSLRRVGASPGVSSARTCPPASSSSTPLAVMRPLAALVSHVGAPGCPKRDRHAELNSSIVTASLPSGLPVHAPPASPQSAKSSMPSETRRILTGRGDPPPTDDLTGSNRVPTDPGVAAGAALASRGSDPRPGTPARPTAMPARPPARASPNLCLMPVPRTSWSLPVQTQPTSTRLHGRTNGRQAGADTGRAPTPTITSSVHPEEKTVPGRPTSGEADPPEPHHRRQRRSRRLRGGRAWGRHGWSCSRRSAGMRAGRICRSALWRSVMGCTGERSARP